VLVGRLRTVGRVTRVRVASWNVLHGQSVRDGGVRVEDLRAAVARIDPDVLVLQEVDVAQPRSGSVDQPSEAAAAMGAATWRFEATVRGVPSTRGWVRDESGPSAYGVALLSRLPVRSWRVRRFDPAPVAMPLVVAGRTGMVLVPDEPRVALAATVEAAGRPLSVVGTHLSFVPGWNSAQLRALTAETHDLAPPRLVVGDLNLPGRVVDRVTRWRRLVHGPTYPAWRPRAQLDHVLADPAWAQVRASGRVVPLPVSDHFAVVVDLDL
jgi:endonuclease/exonuclease/phosphatase family metal-dependent hydrolase